MSFKPTPEKFAVAVVDGSKSTLRASSLTIPPTITFPVALSTSISLPLSINAAPILNTHWQAIVELYFATNASPVALPPPDSETEIVPAGSISML